MTTPHPERPRVLFVGTVRYDLPLAGAVAAKWSALAECLEWRVLARLGDVAAPDDRFELIGRRGPRLLGALWFHLALLGRLRRSIARFRPDAIVAQSPYEGAHALFALRRDRHPPRLVIEVHADWRTATRSYGGPLRRALAGAADAIALAALRRADVIRTVSATTTQLVERTTGRRPSACFPAFVDERTFVERPPVPLPASPAILWAGALQPVKGFGVLARAWPEIAAGAPQARLLVAGEGPQRPAAVRLASRWRGRVEILGHRPSEEVARLMDEATVLVVPSLSEAFGRVALEAMARGRPVVASAVEGLEELVEDGVSGLLVPAGDADALAKAVLRILGDAKTAEALANAARERAARMIRSDAQYAEATLAMVMGGPGHGKARHAPEPPA